MPNGLILHSVRAFLTALDFLLASEPGALGVNALLAGEIPKLNGNSDTHVDGWSNLGLARCNKLERSISLGCCCLETCTYSLSLG